MRFLGIIRHNAERLARLTEDLLTLSRVEANAEIRFDSFRVNELLHDVVDMMRPIAEKNRITMRDEPGPDDAVCAATARPFRRF